MASPSNKYAASEGLALIYGETRGEFLALLEAPQVGIIEKEWDDEEGY